MIAVTARDVGATMRDRRKKLGLTQAQVASMAGVTRQWLIGVEQGKRSAELELVLRCLHVLQLTVDLVSAVSGNAAIELDNILGGN